MKTGYKTTKRKRKHRNSYPNYSGQSRHLHSCLRDSFGRIIRPISNPHGKGAIGYELLDITNLQQIYPDKTGRRGMKKALLYSQEHTILNKDWNGDIYKYCTHCRKQNLLPLTEFTSNDHGYEACLLTEKSAKKYHLKGHSSQPFCKDCKRAYVNSSGNKKRTKDQHIESAALSRYRGLLPEYLKDSYNKKYSNNSVFNKFNHQCFKCDKDLDIDDSSAYQIDHTLPAALYWPLNDNNCTLLCYDCNQAKTDQWTSMFYCEAKIEELSKLTGYEGNLLSGAPTINPEYLEFCKSAAFNKHINDWYSGQIGRRKSKEKIAERADAVFKKLIDKIEKYCYNTDKKIILSVLAKNQHTRHFVEIEGR